MNNHRFAFAALASCATSCVVTPEKLLRTATPSTDPAYGYNAAHAIPIRNGDLTRSILSSRYFLGHLRTASGKQLRVVSRRTATGPSHSELIDLYTLVPESGTDTVRLYLNAYQSGPLQVPRGLQLMPDAAP